MPLDVARHAVGDRTLIRVRLLDRRLSPPREDDFLFQNQVEVALYGTTSGALYRLYQRCVRVLHARRARWPHVANLSARSPRAAHDRARPLVRTGAPSKPLRSPSRRPRSAKAS